MRWTLARFLSSMHGVFGVMYRDENGLALFTCEDDALHIAPGVYELRRSVWHGGGGLPTFEIMVPGRSRILFHPGNTEEDTIGCVLTGMSLGVVRVRKSQDTGQPGRKLAVLESRKAHALFMRVMDGVNRAELEVLGEAE